MTQLRQSALGQIESILDDLIRTVSESKPPSFRDLAAAAGLDPGRDFIQASLRDLDLRDEDLRGFDFSGADLSGADFRRANIAGMRFAQADLTGAIGIPHPQMPDGIVRVFEIVNRIGLDATPSAQFVKIAEQFDAEVTVSKDDQTVPGNSIMGLLMLGASPGALIVVEATGPEAIAVLDALQELVASKFNGRD